MSEISPSGSHLDANAHTAEPNTRLIWTLIFSVLVFLVIFHISAYFWFLGMKDTELRSKQNYSQDKNLQSLRAQDTEVLERYGWVDSAKGTVRIPVSRAMELMVQERSTGKK